MCGIQEDKVFELKDGQIFNRTDRQSRAASLPIGESQVLFLAALMRLAVRDSAMTGHM